MDKEERVQKYCPLCGKPAGVHLVDADVYHMPCLMAHLAHLREKK